MPAQGGSAPGGNKKTFFIALSVLIAAVFLCGADARNAEAKKAKHNYKTANFFSAIGDQTNADVTAEMTSDGYNYRYFYKRIAVPGLKISDPLPLRLFGEYANAYLMYPAGSWTGRSNFSITDGYAYLQYGSGIKFSDWIYSFINTGNYKLFTYYGGKSAKKSKRQCARIFDVSVSGDDNDADAAIVPFGYSPITYYYRKISVKNLRPTSLPDYQVYKKDTYDPGLGAESWASSGFSFFTNDYAWIAYGIKTGGTYRDISEGNFRVCFPEKVKKSNNHTKRYAFSVSGDESNADVSFDYNSTVYYYRKIAVPGLKIDNQLNMRLVKKANFVSGFSGEAWTGGSYYAEDENIYVLYGRKSSYNNVYYDTGTGDYRLFVYK